jgi:hypothetical protein
MLDPMHTGVMVNHIAQGSSAFGKLKLGDIITKINGYNVDYDGTMKLSDIVKNFQSMSSSSSLSSNEGNILLSEDEVSTFSSLVGLTLPGDMVVISIVREGKSRDIRITMQTRDFLVPISYYQMNPTYYILGGFVFVPLSRMYIMENIKKDRDVGNLIGFAEGGYPEKSGDQIIVASTVLSSAITHGYDVNNYVLDTINGHEIRSMKQLKKVVDSILNSLRASEFIVISYMDSSEIHVLNVGDVKKYGKKIIEENIGSIPVTNIQS